MALSEGQVRDIAALREEMAARASRLQSEAEALERGLAALDEVLRGSSFSRASRLGAGPDGGIPGAREPEAPAGGGAPGGGGAIPITREGGGGLIANAYVTPERVSIVMGDGVRVSDEVPPFRSFFLDRIVGEMRKKDEAGGGGPAIECAVSKDGGDISEITITNYGDRARADELVSSAGWSLRRMLEKVGG